MKASDVMKRLSSGEMISILKEIYSEKLDQQTLRYKDAVQSFIDYFGDQDIMIISVPGKCEIGGNHTDHQRGRVLASAIQLDSIAIIAKQERYAKVIYNEMSINEIDTENIKYNEAKKGTMESLINGALRNFKPLPVNYTESPKMVVWLCGLWQTQPSTEAKQEHHSNRHCISRNAVSIFTIQ